MTQLSSLKLFLGFNSVLGTSGKAKHKISWSQIAHHGQCATEEKYLRREMYQIPCYYGEGMDKSHSGGLWKVSL